MASPRLSDLPPELLEHIGVSLERPDFIQLSLVGKRLRDFANGHIWREVDLVDCGKPGRHYNPEDDHDDTAIIRKLLVLATNKSIARCVHTLNHRCHLQPPLIFDVLPSASLTDQILSYDSRLLKLVQIAVNNLQNLHTLRIIYGHPRLTEALLWSLFDRHRVRSTSIQRLWLESCHLSEGLQLELAGHKNGLSTQLDFCNLQSLRIRRLPMHTSIGDILQDSSVMVRAKQKSKPRIMTHPPSVRSERVLGSAGIGGCAGLADNCAALTKYYSMANQFDDEIYIAKAKEIDLPQEMKEANLKSHQGRALWAYSADWNGEIGQNSSDLPHAKHQRLRKMYRIDRPAPASCVLAVLQQCSTSLTSLNFDWVLIRPAREHVGDTFSCPDQLDSGWFWQLFNLRFPNLRAFQFRNCITQHIQMPDNIYLLDRSHWPSCRTLTEEPHNGGHYCPYGLTPLSFIEAHPKLQCLTWPLDRFFRKRYIDSDFVRMNKVARHLSMHLIELRLDTESTRGGERSTDKANSRTRSSRRRFIEDFAPLLSKLQHIKLSGGMPLDERREILRALHRCPLERISLIGGSSSIGSTWGWGSMRYGHIPGSEAPHEEDTAIYRLGYAPPTTPGSDFEFSATYRWKDAAPLLHTIASFHSRTLQELKLCGFVGAAMLFHPTPITFPMLSGLRYLDKLTSLTMSFWVRTFFEDSYRDKEVIEFWNAPQDPSSTALVLVNAPEPEEGTWQQYLMNFEPSTLCAKVISLVGPHLSETAKRRDGGFYIRASFAIGSNSDIYDMDILIGKDINGRDVCLEYRGPQEEHSSDRRKQKLQRRRWF